MGAIRTMADTVVYTFFISMCVYGFLTASPTLNGTLERKTKP